MTKKKAKPVQFVPAPAKAPIEIYRSPDGFTRLLLVFEPSVDAADKYLVAVKQQEWAKVIDWHYNTDIYTKQMMAFVEKTFNLPSTQHRGVVLPNYVIRRLDLGWLRRNLFIMDLKQQGKLLLFERDPQTDWLKQLQIKNADHLYPAVVQLACILHGLKPVKSRVSFSTSLENQAARLR